MGGCPGKSGLKVLFTKMSGLKAYGATRLGVIFFSESFPTIIKTQRCVMEVSGGRINFSAKKRKVLSQKKLTAQDRLFEQYNIICSATI